MPPLPPQITLPVLRLYWCHQCRRPVAILPSPAAAFCPRCFDHFIHDLDFTLLPPPPQPESFIFDFPFSQFFPPRPTFPRSHRSVPPLPTIPSLPPPPLPPNNLDHRDYFSGPNIGELVEELTQSDRTGPPPAPRSVIDALPTVVITEAHLRSGSECPVCKEDLAVGEEAREMPCLHVYHSDCIVPWLRLHNSCPVCRFQLPGGETAVREQSRARSGGRGGARRSRRQVSDRWRPFTLLSAFRGSPSAPGWDRRRDTDRREQPDSNPIPTDSPAAFYWWWRSLFLL